MRLYHFIPLCCLFLIVSCDTSLKGDLNENLPPRTFLAVEDINMPDGERLSSQVRIRWWGDDPDGYVAGYEYCIGEISECGWNDAGMTTDTVFVLPIPEGEDTDDVIFSVRAYDNEGLRDPDGASVVFPIKNSPPNITLVNADLPADSTFNLMSFGWEATDPDGQENLRYIEFSVNDTTENGWFQLAPGISYLTLDITDDSGEEASASVYIGRALSTTDEEINGLRINDTNTLYIRAVDQALAQSEVREVEWHIKRQESNILVVNDIRTLQSEALFREHLHFLDTLDINRVDILDLSNPNSLERGDLNTSQSETLVRQFARWDHIYWVSDTFTRRIQFAPQFLSGFFNDGGTMFFTSPTGNYSEQNSIVQFLPIEGMKPLPDGAINYQIGRNAVIKAQSTFLQDLIRDSITLDRSSRPLIPLGDATVIYEAPFTDSNDFQAEPYYLPIAVVNNERNLGFFGMDLTILKDPKENENDDENENETIDNLIDALDYILKQQLNFELR